MGGKTRDAVPGKARIVGVSLHGEALCQWRVFGAYLSVFAWLCHDCGQFNSSYILVPDVAVEI